MEEAKVREAQAKKEAEVKMLEKMVGTLREEKRDLEGRVGDMVERQDRMRCKHVEEHHKTVQWFESRWGEAAERDGV